MPAAGRGEQVPAGSQRRAAAAQRCAADLPGGHWAQASREGAEEPASPPLSVLKAGLASC